MKIELFCILFSLFAAGTVNVATAQDVEPDAPADAAEEALLEQNDVPALPETDTIMPPAGFSYAEALPACARPDSNFIRLPGGLSPEMTAFFNKVDSVLLFGQGRVSVLHMGGSHVQADYYTDVIRLRLDSLNRDLRPARGLIFPFRMAKTNNPSNYSVAYGGTWDKARCSVYKPRPALGMSGISVFTADTAAWFSIGLNTNGSHRWTASRLHLIGRCDKGTLTPVLTAAGKTYSPKRTANGYLFTLAAPVDSFTVAIHRVRGRALDPDDRFFVDALLPQNDEDGIVYHTIGVNGAATGSYLGCELFERQLAELKPDLVIFGIGINDSFGPDFSDALFRRNYNALIEKIRRVSPHCAFIFLTNNDSFKRRRPRRRARVVQPNGLIAQQSFYKLAEQWQGGLWDLFEVMGGLSSMNDWMKQGLAQKDRVHFSRLGYTLVGNMFYDAFLNFYLSQEPIDDVQ